MNDGIDLDLNLIFVIGAWLISGGGAGIVAYWIWEQLERIFPALSRLDSTVELVIVTFLTAIIGVGDYFLLGWLGAVKLPSDAKDWVIYLVAVLGLVFASSRFAHQLFKVRPAEIRARKEARYNL